MGAPAPAPVARDAAGLVAARGPKTLALATTGGGIPAHVSRTLPPALFGTTLHFQARTQSSVAPAGEAYSNSLSITLVP